MHENSVISASDKPAQEAHLRGYALIGADVVLGDVGRERYGAVPSGHDGAYVSVAPAPGGRAVIGTDDTGYSKLFLYRSGNKWAIGASLMELAEYVSNRRWPLEIDQGQLKTFLLRSRGMMGNQLTSLRTVFSEIRLLAPSEYALVTRGASPSVDIRRRPEEAPSDYTTALQDALDEMTGLLGTLIRSGLPVVSDITGGRDSRTVLAVLQAANTTGQPVGDRVRFRSNRKQSEDWAIAKELSKKYGLAVNRAPEVDTYAVDPQYAYRAWRENDLGVYSPLYLFTNHSGEIALNGAAGGVHRSVYTKATVAEQIRSVKTDWLTDSDIDHLVHDAEETLASYSDHPDPRLTHFRLFRNRIHGGRNALRSVSVAPLGSKKLRQASSLLPDEHLDRAQFYADVMLNLAPDLAAEPYDSPKKGWDEQHHKDLTRVRVSPSRYTGDVFGEIANPPAQRFSKRTRLDPFFDAFQEAAPQAAGSGLLPRKYIDDAARVLSATDGKAFRHATDGVSVSTVILAGQASGMSR